MQRFHNAMIKFTHRYCYCSTECIVEAVSVVYLSTQFLMKIFCTKRQINVTDDGKYSAVLRLALGPGVQHLTVHGIDRITSLSRILIA